MGEASAPFTTRRPLHRLRAVGATATRHRHRAGAVPRARPHAALQLQLRAAAERARAAQSRRAALSALGYVRYPCKTSSGGSPRGSEEGSTCFCLSPASNHEMEAAIRFSRRGRDVACAARVCHHLGDVLLRGRGTRRRGVPPTPSAVSRDVSAGRWLTAVPLDFPGPSSTLLLLYHCSPPLVTLEPSRRLREA